MTALKKKAPRGLGKGLSALMSDNYSQTTQELFDNQKQVPVENEAGTEAKQTLPVHKIQSGVFQPRSYFHETALRELADSIRRNGVMQPILVREIGDGMYEIIAGERRWRAAKLAGLSDIPVIIRSMSDSQSLEVAIVENVQREDLQPLEEAAGYQRLMSEFGYSHEDIATTVHKSRSHIANLLRLLSLPGEIQEMLSRGELSMGHARALIGLEDAVEIAQEVVRKGWNVRQTEKRANYSKNPAGEGKVRPRKPRAAAPVETPLPPAAIFHVAPPAVPETAAYRQKDPDILALEETLSETLGLTVNIADRGQSGEITISYDSLDQLDNILRRLGGGI